MSIEAIGAPAPPVAMDVELPADSVNPKPAAALHSPPDSNDAVDADGSDSELSDLDEVAGKLDGALEDEFQAEIKAELKAEPKTDVGDAPIEEEEPKVEPEDGPEPPVVEDIGEILPDHWSGTVPVFKPTMKQFQDFKRFMEKVDKYGMKSGIIKIIAPQEWKESLPPIDNLIKQIRVREPIKQEIMGSTGTYRQVNVLHQRSYNLPQWRQLCDQSEHQPPARRGERRANADRRAATRTRGAAAANPSPAKKRGRGGRATRRSTRGAKEDPEEDEDRPMTPVSPAPEKEEVVKSVEEEREDSDEDGPPIVRRMGSVRQSKQAKTQSVSARRKYIRREGSAMIDEAAFRDWDYHMDISEFTPERCEELEKTYWKTLTYAPPLYGADLPGTLFDDSVDQWNLNNLPNLLDVLGTKVPGVNTAYLYLGMWKATFAWHLEDVDLYSINYLHFGAPKQWYSISQADARRFEAAMKNIWPTEAKACDQFLRHKGFLISPSHLKQNYNITVNKCVSYPGEFVVTYPYGYHSGYNLGYNCAEAVNFALDSWLPMGKIAKKCQCAQAQDSVWVDVYEIERKLRGEETEYEETDEEDEDEDDDDLDTGLPSPPSSHTVRVKAPGRKRKRGANDKEPRTKTKKVRVRLKAHAEPPCCLCPSDIPGAEIMPTDDGRKAHRMCALYLPETYIETVDGQEIIANAGAIDKARLELKCLYCRSKRGACFQCSQKKCPRAYHATCAAAAGVFVEEAEVPVFGEDGTEYKEQAFEFSCRFHRTKRDRKADGDVLSESPVVRAAAKALKKNDVCQLHDRVEVEWKWLLLPDPADFRLPKASPNAIPMPTSRKAQREINAKRSADEAPRKDDEFGPGFTWAEFHGGEVIKNRAQVKIDLARADQIWHYLGNTSTEAKAQYTDDPSKPWHNPKGNFLDTIPKPPPPARVASVAQARPLVPGGHLGYTAAFTGLPQAGVSAAKKKEKPYVYKPRKPVALAPGQTPAPFTSHTFAVNSPSPSPSPAPGPAFQQFQAQPMAARPPAQQPTFHQHVFPQHPQQQQFMPPPPPHMHHHQHQYHQPQQQQQQEQAPLRQAPQHQHTFQVQPYPLPGPDVPRKGASAPYSSDRFAPVGGSNGFPKLPGLSWPPAHMTSGPSHSPQWPVSMTGAAAPMTASALPSPGGNGHTQPHAGGVSEVCFPEVNQDKLYFFIFMVILTRHRDSGHRPSNAWNAYPNAQDGNFKQFMAKAQKALSGGNSKGSAKQAAASNLQPARPRPEYPQTSSAYPQLLPRPPPTSQSPSPYPPMASGSPAPMYHHGYLAQHNGPQPIPVSPHPPSQTQYGAPQFYPQPHMAQPSQHTFQVSPQPPQPPQPQATSQPAPATAPAKAVFTKQSHSPIPLPPYVRQMAAASTPTSSPKTPTPSSAAAPAAPSPGASVRIKESPAISSPGAPARVKETPVPIPIPGLPMQGAQGAPAANAGLVAREDNNTNGNANTNDSSALVEKMMVNLRRASLSFARGDLGAQNLVEEQAQAQTSSQQKSPQQQPPALGQHQGQGQEQAQQHKQEGKEVGNQG
ncbi:uncharacterized protein C8A04DRAFT_14280 [Dichotomopilus funicola]|uniref:[histone H3]-trimethyl-L-lysine(9) demethylase n=1 Tax=Dichotomopilus funicola TaxID=1934379 RepID=A0AAN6ZKR5_9PEZI|nr:hypothetical protein C8A04DRAFT_14280 [Dichotomopilus funicola]